MYCRKDDEMKQLMDDLRLDKYYNLIANELEKKTTQNQRVFMKVH